jgi:hypothetical protein
VKEFVSNSSHKIIIEENVIKIQCVFHEECRWCDIVDYDLELKNEKKRGSLKITTKKRSYFFYFSQYNFNDFVNLYNLFCENCETHKAMVDIPHIEDVSAMMKFAFSFYHKTTVILDDGYIVIAREGALNALAHGIAGEKRIRIADIMAVQFKEPGIGWGYIQFTLPGSIESNRGMSSATTDENTIIFDKSELNYAIRIKKYVEDVLSKKDTCNQNTNNVADEIRKYQQLLDDGIITQEEFKNMKKKIIS